MRAFVSGRVRLRQLLYRSGVGQCGPPRRLAAPLGRGRARPGPPDASAGPALMLNFVSPAEGAPLHLRSACRSAPSGVALDGPDPAQSRPVSPPSVGSGLSGVRTRRPGKRSIRLFGGERRQSGRRISSNRNPEPFVPGAAEGTPPRRPVPAGSGGRSRRGRPTRSPGREGSRRRG